MTTYYFRNAIIGNVFRSKTDPALPSNLYIGLSTTTPNVSGGGKTEPSGGNYARVDATRLFGAPSNGVVNNVYPVVFNESTASWGTVTHYVIFDAATNGHVLMYGALNSPMAIGSGEQAVIAKNEIQITLSDSSS